MNRRLESMDLLRGFCLVLMVFINFFDEIAAVSILTSKKGFYIDFVITSMVPNTFIALMGFFLIVSGSFCVRKLMAKGVQLLLLGLVINLLRYPLPQFVGNKLGLTEYGGLTGNAVYHLLMIDIYSFAGYALLALMPLTLLPLASKLYLFLSALVLAFAGYGGKLLSLVPDFLTDIFAYIVVGTPQNVYFPLLPWLSYLLFGIALGLLYREQGREKFFGFLLVGGSVVFLTGLYVFVVKQPEEFSMLNDFYKHDYTVGLLLFGITMLLPALSEKLLQLLPKFFKNWLSLTSRHIITFYFSSWMFTGWFVTLRGSNNDFGISECIFGAAIIYLLSTGVVYGALKLKQEQGRD